MKKKIVTGKKKNVKTSTVSKAKKKILAKAKTKKAFRFAAEKLDLVRQTMISVLWSKEELQAAKLKSETEKILGKLLLNEFDVYYNHVMELLLKHNMIEYVKTPKVTNLRLVQRLE